MILFQLFVSSLTMSNMGGLQRVMTEVDATTVGNKMRERQGGRQV